MSKDIFQDRGIVVSPDGTVSVNGAFIAPEEQAVIRNWYEMAERLGQDAVMAAIEQDLPGMAGMVVAIHLEESLRAPEGNEGLSGIHFQDGHIVIETEHNFYIKK